MSTQSDDLARPAAGQREQWDSVAAGWQRWWRTIESGAQQVSKRMLDLAEVEPGQRVLDIATGIGEPALLAALRVGTAGQVTATDLSSNMLDIARERAATMGLSNVEFIEADAEQLAFPDGSFDIVLCRWGLTSFPNPLKTLAAIHRMLAPNGSVAASVWKEGPKGRPLASLTKAVAHDVFDLPSPAPEAPPINGSAMKTLAKDLIDVGFRGVRVEEVALTLDFRSTEDCTQYLVDVSPEVAALLSNKSPGKQRDYRQGLADKLQPYVVGDGAVRVPNVAVCAVGRT